MKTITFDIETIPQRSDLSPAQVVELEKRENKYYWNKDREDCDQEDVRKMLMGTNPLLGEIVCIGLLGHSDSGASTSKSLFVTDGIREKEMLEEFWEILGNPKSKGSLFVSFNGLGFDVPWIIKRSMVNGILPTNNEFLNTRRYLKYPHFDVLQVLADYSPRDYMTLDLACDMLGVETPKDGEIKAENVAQAFKDGQIQEIADYCLKDIEATYKVYEIVSKYVHTQRY